MIPFSEEETTFQDIALDPKDSTLIWCVYYIPIHGAIGYKMEMGAIWGPEKSHHIIDYGRRFEMNRCIPSQ